MADPRGPEHARRTRRSPSALAPSLGASAPAATGGRRPSSRRACWSGRCSPTSSSRRRCCSRRPVSPWVPRRRSSRWCRDSCGAIPSVFLRWVAAHLGPRASTRTTGRGGHPGIVGGRGATGNWRCGPGSQPHLIGPGLHPIPPVKGRTSWASTGASSRRPLLPRSLHPHSTTSRTGPTPRRDNEGPGTKSRPRGTTHERLTIPIPSRPRGPRPFLYGNLRPPTRPDSRHRKGSRRHFPSPCH